MLRNDGSVKSANFPGWSNKHAVRDYGIYRGAIRAVLYIDDDFNSSKHEVLYKVIIIGGDRDGQMFNSARLMRGLGGAFNYTEIGMKATEGASAADPASIEAQVDPSLRDISTQNGDVVYIQFLGGDITMPIIVGFGHHKKAPDEAAEADGQRYINVFNGIKTQIDADGIFTLTKDNGAYAETAPNIDDPTYPLVNQFAPLPGQAEAFTLTLDNDYSLALAFSPGPTFTMKGAADDSIELTTALGNSVALTTSGIAMTSATGESLELASGAVTAASAGGASLELDAMGFVKLGNSTGDVLKDILLELIKALSTEAPSGFGAPLVGVATYIQLLTKLQLITG